MKSPEEIFQILKAEFPDSVFEIDSELQTESLIIIDPLKINELSLFLRDNEDLRFDSLMNLSGVDDDNREKITEEDGTITTKGGTFSVYYHLHSTILNHKVTLKVSTNWDKPEVESVDKIWKASTWHERETYDMYGVIFEDHPGLRRFYMPEDYVDPITKEPIYPLRKDFVDEVNIIEK